MDKQGHQLLNAPRVVMELLGHTQISVTMDIYGHVLPETQREAAERIAALFLPPDETTSEEQPEQ